MILDVKHKKSSKITQNNFCLNSKLLTYSTLRNSGYKRKKIVGCSRWFYFSQVGYGARPHLSNQYERYELQYTFVNPFETDCDRFIDIRFSIKYMTYESPLKKYLF